MKKKEEPTIPPVEILETLGEGAFGVVCVARLTMGGVERAVALKILKGEWADHVEVLQRTKDEARLLALLNHPYIVKVDQLTRLWDRVTIVMEYVPGASLLEICQAIGPLPVSVALTVTQRVASALHAAYNRPPPGRDMPLRVVHRDIKPSNILVGIDGEVKVLDYGTARGEFASREANTKILGFGSMGYLAPERLEGSVKGPEIDIYSLGVVLYEILCGHRLGNLPMRPDHQEQKLYQKVGRLQLHLGSPEPDRLVRELLVQMMAYDPARRPRAVEVVHVCEDILRRLPGPNHVSTEAFAREVVEPIYQNRKRRPAPEDLNVAALQPGELASLTASLPLSGDRKSVV